jgi:hypothetical protein
LSVRERPNPRGEEDGERGSGLAEYMMVHIDLSLIRVHGVTGQSILKILYAGGAREETKTTHSI